MYEGSKGSLDKIVYNKYIEQVGIARKNIGVELEFPIIDLKKEYKYSYRDEFFALLEEMGFHRDKKQKYKTENSIGDVISYEYSYNCIEFSLKDSESIFDIKERFFKYFDKIQLFLAKYDCFMVGMGLHPHWTILHKKSLNTSHYQMVEKFLDTKFVEYTGHMYPEFCAFISSCQTHVEISRKWLIPFLGKYYLISGFKGLLFSNSLDVNGSNNFLDTNCTRDYLWMKSNFGYYGNSVGYYEKIETEDDLVKDIKRRGLYYVKREDVCYLIKPQRLEEIESKKKVAGKSLVDSKELIIELVESDINTFRSYKMAELTSRGTIEIREDCQQPINACFEPVAIMAGICEQMEKLLIFLNSIEKRIIEEFGNDRYAFRKYAVSAHKDVPQWLNQLLKEFVDIAVEGLKMRGYGEEILLENLLKRGNLYDSPAERLRTFLKDRDVNDFLKLQKNNREEK